MLPWLGFTGSWLFWLFRGDLVAWERHRPLNIKGTKQTGQIKGQVIFCLSLQFLRLFFKLGEDDDMPAGFAVANFVGPIEGLAAFNQHLKVFQAIDHLIQIVGEVFGPVS